MSTLQPLIRGLAVLYLVSMMFALGLDLGGEPKTAKADRWAKRRLLFRGLVLDLVVLPLAAFGIARALHASGDVCVALLLLVAVPGGRYAPHLVKLGGGNVALEAESTLLLAKFTAFTAAPTARWLLRLDALDVHELPLILQLVLWQLLPFLAGKWLRSRRPPVAERLRRPAQGFAIGVALATFVAILLRDERGIVHLLDDRAWFAVLAVGIASPLIAWLFGGRNQGARRAFAIGANCREGSLALVIASLAYPGGGSVRTALLGIWSLMALASFFLALSTRKTRRREPSPHRGGGLFRSKPSEVAS